METFFEIKNVGWDLKAISIKVNTNMSHTLKI